MKVLWISNIVFPEVDALLSGKSYAGGSGGWLTSLANAIKEEVCLVVAAPSRRVGKLRKVEVGGIVHYIIPFGKGNEKYNREYEPIWREIKNAVKPDLVHIHGTEYSHGLAYLRACGSENVVVSIQGVMTEIARHYLDGLSNKDILHNLTLHDVFKTTLWGTKKKAKERAKSEPEMLRMVKNVIGRTDFDHANVLSINPSIKYYHCDEVLRDEFYTGKWVYDKCTAHTIFISNGKYPLKGFHMLLRALPLIIEKYPNVMVKVAGGNNPIGCGFKYRIKTNGYQNIIAHSILSNSLLPHIKFLGILSADEMKKQMLDANIFLVPSSNENSSNSLGEAQLLGVPCLASFVGGLPTMIPNNECGEMYNYFDTNMLAYKLCNIFENSSSFDNSNMILHATKRHDKDVIKKTLLKIYCQILEGADEISKKN